MWLTDRIFLRTHVTVCEYLVLHEFRRNLCITLAKYLEQEGIRDLLFFKFFIQSFGWSLLDEISGKLAKQGAVKNISKICNNLYLLSREIISVLDKEY